MSRKENIQAERRRLMLDTPIHRLIPKMALPTIVAMLITSIYSLADTFFVSSLGISATAAVGVNMSLDQAILMMGSFLAIGANSYIARLLGAKQKRKASNTLSTAFFLAFFLGTVLMIPGLIFSDGLVRLLGATDSSAPFAKDYCHYILLATPFMASSFVLNQCIRSEGSPIFSMLGMGIGGILNIVLDPIFIFTLDMGVAGAAIASSISKLVGFCILIYPYLSKRSVLRLSLKFIKFSRDIIREISLMGLPSLLRMGLGVISQIVINNVAGSYSDSALAAITVCARVMMFPISAILGFGHGFMPVAGYNWGARQYKRVRKSFRFSSLCSALCIAVVCVVFAIFSESIILLFSEGDESLLSIGRFCLITQCIAMPLNAWVITVNMLYSAMGKPVGAIILGMSRQGFCLLPMLLILPHLFGIGGLAASQAVADGISFLLTIPFAVVAMKNIRIHEKNELCLPESTNMGKSDSAEN